MVANLREGDQVLTLQAERATCRWRSPKVGHHRARGAHRYQRKPCCAGPRLVIDRRDLAHLVCDAEQLPFPDAISMW